MHTHNKHRTIYRSEVTGKAEVYESTDSEKRQTGKWADLKKYADNYTIDGAGVVQFYPFLPLMSLWTITFLCRKARP